MCQILHSHRTTLREASLDNHEKDNPSYMTESNMEVFNFDAIKCQIARELGKQREDYLKSIDALYMTRGGHYYLIEFKNQDRSDVKTRELRHKTSESIILLSYILEKTISFLRHNVSLIVVFSPPPSHNQFSASMDKKAAEKAIEFGLNKFKDVCLHDIFTINVEEFDTHFVAQWEAEQNCN